MLKIYDDNAAEHMCELLKAEKLLLETHIEELQSYGKLPEIVSAMQARKENAERICANIKRTHDTMHDYDIEYAGKIEGATEKLKEFSQKLKAINDILENAMNIKERIGEGVERLILGVTEGIKVYEELQGMETDESEEVEILVTLEELKNVPDGWNIRTMISYDSVKSIPTYAEGTREITQEDIDEINRVLWKYEINTPNRIAHFLSQCYVETGGGFGCVEQYTDEPYKDFSDYEVTGNKLGNTTPGDGALFRGAGAIHMTGRAAYESFSVYIGDPKIASDGALYVGKNYYWEAAGYYWTIYKPTSASGDTYNLNKKCDENASVEEISRRVNGGDTHLEEREKAYAYFSEVIK